MASWFERIFGSRKAEAPVAKPVTVAAPVAEPAPDEAEKIGWLRDTIRRDVAAGFFDEDEILRNAADCYEEELEPALLRREAQRLLREALAEHVEAQRGWPARTDCDRLDDAFAALEADGVIARQNFTCCGTCGSAEIWDEIQAAEAAGLPARGYAFYHAQDTESAAEGRGVYLNYGACEDGEAAALAVARDILIQLEAHGLEAHWDGSWGQRIGVSLDWKRRR